MSNKIRYVTSDGRIDYAEKPSIKPLNINGEEGFGVYHSPITVTPTDVYRPLEIKPRFFSEEVADLRDAAEIRRKQADEKVKLMLSGKEYAKLGGLTLAGAAAAGLGAAGLGYLSTLPGAVAGRFIGDAAGSMALGMGLEEGQRAAFGRSAGDIVYSQLKPYIGEFGANMARPEYIISPSMVLKNTYTLATNNLGRLFERETTRGNKNKSYSFLGSFFPKLESDLYAILNSRNPEFGSGLTYLYGKDLFPTNNFTLNPDHIYNNSSELALSILKNFNIEGYLNSSGQVNLRKFTLDLLRAYPNSSVTFYTDKNNWRGHSDTYKKDLIRLLDTKYKLRKPLKRNYLPVNKINATISYREPNYKTSDLFNRFFAQLKINGTEFDPTYGAIANYSRGVPEHIKSYINLNTVERAAIAMRKAGYSEREIQQYIEKVNAEMDNVKYGMYSNKDYKDAGFGDFAGFYNDDNNFISVNKESPNFIPDEVFKHEVRHLIDYRTSMTDEMYNILDDAYDKDFLEIPKHENAGSLKDYPHMDREKVTTNLDARNAFFKDKNLTWVLDKNSYAEHTKPRKPRTVAEFFNPPKREYPEDMIEFQNLLIQWAQPEDIVKAVESSNGYGRRYIEYLRETGKLTPEKIEQFRKALMYVPSYILPATGGYNLLKSLKSQNQK